MRPSDTLIVIGPNASLSVRHAWWFWLLTAALGASIGLFFALNGFWPILPFCGLELGALGAALLVTQRRNRYRETLRFSPDRLQLRFGNLGQGRGVVVDWPRTWVQVRIDPPTHRNAPTRLVLSHAGQQLFIGRCLTDQEREDLYSRIRELLPPGWQRCQASGALELAAPEAPTPGAR